HSMREQPHQRFRPTPWRLVIASVCLLSTTAGPRAARTMTFRDRVAAQRAIDRVYQAHQIGPPSPASSSEDPLSESLLESKVRDTLARTAALERYWHTTITGDALHAEAERIARDTRLPGRLLEIYAALGEDRFLVEETFARGVLVDRLARGFF